MRSFGKLINWQNSVCSVLQTTTYAIAYNLHGDPPLIWFTANAFICFIAANMLVQLVITFVQTFILSLLELKQSSVSKVLVVIIDRIVTWETPCLVFLAIARLSPDNASYSSLSFVLLSGLSIALINTLLIVLFDKDFEQKDKEAARLASCFVCLVVLLSLGINFSTVTQKTKQGAASLYDLLAMTEGEFGNYQSTFNLSSDAIKLDPRSWSAYNTRACALQSMNKNQEAIADCNVSLSLKPDAHTYVTRGFSFGALGNKVAQMQDYAAAIKLDPTQGSAYWYRSVAFAKQGDTASAQKDKLKAQELHYFQNSFDQRLLK